MVSLRVVRAAWDRAGPNIQRLAFSFFLWELGFSLYAPLWSVHLRELGARPEQVGAIFSLSYLLSTLTSIPGGLLADRFNRKQIMLFFWVLGSPSALILAFATTWQMAIPGMVLYFSSFMVLPAINAYITDMVGDQDPSPAFALVYVATPTVQLIGPTVGGIVADYYGMRMVLLMAFGCYASSTLMLLFIASQPAPRRLSLVPARLECLRDSRFLLFVALAPLIYLCFYSILPFVGPYLREIHGLSKGWIGVLTSLAAAGGVLFTLITGQTGGRWGQIRTLALAIGLFALGVPLIGSFSAVPLLASGFLLAGCFYAGIMLMVSTVGRLARDKSTGQYFGIFGLASGVGMSLAPWLGGLVYAWSPQALFLGVGLLGAALAVLVFGLRRRLG